MPDQPRARIYNRLWHLDADDRRHHGLRRWEPEALEAVVALAGEMEHLYPPDWSDVAVVRFRASGRERPVAEIRTDDPDHLLLTLGDARIQICTLAEVNVPAFRALFVERASGR